MVPRVDRSDQKQVAHSSPAVAAHLRGTAGTIGHTLRSFGFQAIALLLGIALAFM